MLNKFDFSKLVDISKSFKDGFVAVAVSLITLAAERAIEVILFRCPCHPEQRQLYSWLFIVIPAVFLLVVGIAFNMKLWKLITGCCPSKKYCCCATDGCNDFCTGSSRTRKICCSCNDEFANFCTYLAFAVISPTTWIILTLIDGDYFACATTKDAYVDNTTCMPISMHACK